MDASKKRSLSWALIVGVLLVGTVVLLSQGAANVEKPMAIAKEEFVIGDEPMTAVSTDDMEARVADDLEDHPLLQAQTEEEARRILSERVERDGEDMNLVDDLVSEWKLANKQVGEDSRSRYFYNKNPPAVGGRGGKPFVFQKSGQVITMVCVRSGSLVDAVRVIFADGSSTGYRGGKGGKQNCFRPTGKCISSVFVKAGSLIDGILFADKDGSISPYYGGYGGKGTSVSNDANRCLYKVTGRTRGTVVSLQFFFVKGRPPIIAPPRVKCYTGNVALRRHTGQSSFGWGGSSARAVDGNTNGNYGKNSCTHTQSQLRAFWYVNIGRQAPVCGVRLYNRRDCCADRLTNFKVFVTNRQPVGGFVARPNEICAVYGKAVFSVKYLRCKRPIRGKYVGVQLMGKNYLTICEFQVFTTSKRALPQPSCRGTRNVARGKPTGQISQGWGGVSSRAVDGNTDGVYGRNSCTHTALSNNPWLYVKVANRPISICGVKIFNRQDCCAERLNNFKVFVTNRKPTGNFVASRGETCFYDNSKGPFRTKNIVCTRKMRGMYVGVQIIGRQYLTICELQIFSKMKC